MPVCAYVSCLERDDVVRSAALEDLGHVAQVDAERDVSVGAVHLEALRAQEQRHQRHVRRVHRLQRHARAGAVEVRLVHQILDALQQLLQDGA